MVKLIEKYIPIDFISEISKKEANSKKPIYSIHKWFGRKTDAIIRSVLLATELEETSLLRFKEKYYSDNHMLLKGKIVLDPFCGGGTTLVNALRLGAKTIGIDSNPIAWFITRNELESYKLAQNKSFRSLMNEEFQKLEKSVGEKIKEVYSTTIYDSEKKCSKKVDIMYIFWIKKVVCPECKNEIKLFPKYNLTNDISICSFCGEIISSRNAKQCKKCGNKIIEEAAIIKGRSFTCPSCGNKFNIVKDIMKNQKGPLASEMYAIEYFDSEKNIKGFKKVEIEDINEYKKVSEALKNLSTDFIPSQKIIEGFNTKQVINHNYFLWRQMFNDRQQYCLALLLSEIDNIKNIKIKQAFICIFSNMLNCNNMFCIYNAQCRKLEPLFGDHHMAPVINPIENNVWGTKLGRGSFIKYYGNYIESKEYNFRPFERLYCEGKKTNIYLEGEEFSADFAKDFNELIYGDKNTILKCDSAENISFIPDNSIDIVLTDPPYYAAINYGEISEFFYVWDRILLKESTDCFRGEHINYAMEITENKIKGVSRDDFNRRLLVCFKEIRRVMKENGYLILTYNSSLVEKWASILELLLESGFDIFNTFPLCCEVKAGLIDNRRDKMNFDLVITARKRVVKNLPSIPCSEFAAAVKTNSEKTLNNLKINKISELDKLVIETGEAFTLYSKYYPNILKNGKRLSALEAINEIYSK